MSGESILLLVQQRLALGILADNGTTLEGVLANDTGKTDQHRQDKEDTHDGESKDPLEGNDVGEELRDTQGSGQDREVEAHGVVLVGNQEKEAVAEDGPDEDVCSDTSGEGVSVDCCGANSEQSHIVESQRAGDNGNVDEAGGGRVTEVGSRQVEEVDDEQKQCQPEVRADPEHDHSKEQQVAGDEVRAHIGSSVNVNLIFGVKVPRVAELTNKQDDPVNGNNGGIKSKRCVSARVLAEDGVAVVLALSGLVEGVVE